MLNQPLRHTLGVVALALVGLTPLAAQADFCPLGQLFPGKSSCERRDSCPNTGASEAGGPFRNLLRNIEGRQAELMERIEQGANEGRLSAIETQRLMRGQCQIERMQRQAMADGFLSPWEWAALDEALDQAGRDIHLPLRQPSHNRLPNG